MLKGCQCDLQASEAARHSSCEAARRSTGFWCVAAEPPDVRHPQPCDNTQLLLQKGQNRAGHCGGSVASAKIGGPPVRTSLFTQRLDYNTLLNGQAVALRTPGRGLSSFLCGHCYLLAFFRLQESRQPTPDFFNPQPKPAQQANRSRPNLPVLHWKLARAINLS